MKTFKKMAAQGDVVFRRIDDASKVKLGEPLPPANVNGQVIVTHSETGHHHTMTPKTPGAVKMYASGDVLVKYLEVNEPTPVIHGRPYDTHEPITLTKGLYEIRRQREGSPENWRIVQD